MHRFMNVVAGVGLASLVVTAAGCADASPGVPPARQAPAGGRQTSSTRAEAMETEIYVQVLRRYLSTPAENSFPAHTFKTVYVLDHVYPDAADPGGRQGRGTPIAAQTQRQVTAGLAGTAHVKFVANRESVVEARNGCGQVRDHGILITLGPPVNHGHELRVAINGYVACLGATWLTYVLHDQPGTGWRVTGTTRSMGIA